MWSRTGRLVVAGAVALVVTGMLAGTAHAQLRGRMPGRTVIAPSSTMVRGSSGPVIFSQAAGQPYLNQQMALYQSYGLGYNPYLANPYGLGYANPYYGGYGLSYAPAATSFYNPYAGLYVRRYTPVYNIYYVNPYALYLSGFYP